jgi:outer membrane protein OmpA-like peptidoglycan-associated protein
MTSRESNFFWPSYADLMTSLFFVMLVLYVVTVVVMQYEHNATQQELLKIKEIQNATRQLPKAYFDYQPAYKRFVLNRQIQFGRGQATIPTTDLPYLRDVGRSIRTLIDTLKTRFRAENIKYLVVIEGMASRDNYALNDELSYQRALALNRFWIRERLRPDSSVCEVIVAGSGKEGAGREQTESRNQRILIQIIPKIGTIQTR